MDWLELMSSEHFHVLLHSDKKHGLIFNRLDDTVATIDHNDAKELSNLKRIGRVHGVVGRFLNRYLVLIKKCALVGTLYEPNTETEHEVYVITQVQVVDVSCISVIEAEKLNSVRYDATPVRDDTDSKGLSYFTEMPNSSDPEDFSSLPITISTNSYTSNQSRATPWNPFKLANSFKPKMPTQFLRSTAESIMGEGAVGGLSQTTSQTEDSDKRLVEEMVKLFNNTNSFYFSPTLDLTNRFSRKTLVKQAGDEPIWKTADERFFWNKHMLKDLIELSLDNADANFFICVILQGFIAIEKNNVSDNPCNDSGVENGLLATSANALPPRGNSNCDRDIPDHDEKSHTQPASREYQLALVSRRSVFQAGTRYRRRGCDEKGNCANFVETEQIFRHNQHFTSVVILRGSIPLFWYQSGFNYRPPPVLYKNQEENHRAFKKHYMNLTKAYETENIISVDCTEHTGREKVLHDAFKQHIEILRSSYPEIRLIEFDFHKHCRGRQCSDTQVEKHLKSCGLTDQLIKGVKYYWNDGDVVWNQSGVLRVNCLDCSDRTNVVQRAIALQILDLQLARLGIIAPDTCPEDNECRKVMQQIWSTNGNVLSTQYCGTRALFTGDKKLSGYLKDTYSSASRYYISKFRDAYRQAAIDAMLGVENNDGNFRPGEQDQNATPDEHELINLDPMLMGSGGALLRDVGNRVTNRLARLKGKFYSKPSAMETSGSSRRMTGPIDEMESDFSGVRIESSLNDMNIDWPSPEDVEPVIGNNYTNNIFAQFTNSDDSFQDDEFGQLMLSIDLAELQRLQEASKSNCSSEGTDKEKKKQDCENINMTEASNLGINSSSDNTKETTSTTSA